MSVAETSLETLRWRIGIAFGAGCSHKLRRNHELQRFGAYTRAIRNDEIAQPEQRFVFLPHRNIEKRVGADDEKNAIAGSMIGVAKIANRINGVMQLRTSKILAGFSEGRNEMRMLGAGERNHGVAMRKWREVLFQLVRRAAGWNEMDFVKIEAAVRGARDGEMSVVNGIEGAAKQSNAAGLMSCCSVALRLRGGQ